MLVVGLMIFAIALVMIEYHLSDMPRVRRRARILWATAICLLFFFYWLTSHPLG